MREEDSRREVVLERARDTEENGEELLELDAETATTNGRSEGSVMSNSFCRVENRPSAKRFL